MLLKDLSRGCLDAPERLEALDITGIASDSREVKPGTLFVALPGPRTDGRLYLRQARERGAVAAVLEEGDGLSPEGKDASSEDPGIPLFRVPDARKTLGGLAARFYGTRDRSLCVTGITGTKGKTTTAWILDTIVRSAGKVSALLGTVHNRIGERVFPSTNTTPGCLELHQHLQELAARGGAHAVLEVSSHGILQRRAAGIEFRCGIFTNVAPEHLDYHKTFESYVSAKRQFFEELSPDAFAVLPREEPRSEDFARHTPAKVAWYGTRPQDGVEDIRTGTQGTTFAWKGSRVQTRLWGQHNLLNLLGAMTAAGCLGFSREDVIRGAAAAGLPPGRLEEVPHPGPFRVFVDYAHTDGSLETVLRALRGITTGRLITIFGCGGDRDTTKRPRMGRVAEKWSDKVVVTSDNPRSEDPMAIIQHIVAGLEHPETAVCEADRRLAIERGIRMARPNDTVLIAGKGHEDYQEFKGRKVHFDDREVAREFLSVFPVPDGRS